MTGTALSPDRHDPDRFVAAIEAMYAAAVDPSEWPSTLQAIADLTDDVGAVMMWRGDDGRFGTIVSPSLEAAQRDYDREWWQHDIRAQRAVKYGFWAGGESYTERHCITAAEVEGHPFYTQFLASHGLKWCAATGISPDPQVAAAISVQRGADRDPFSDEELQHLTRVGRHVERALRLGIRLIDAELTSAGIGEALSRARMGVFVLDRLGRIVFINSAGEGLLGDGLAVAGNRLVATFAPQRTVLEAGIAKVLSTERCDVVDVVPPVLVQRIGSERPLVLYLLPIRSGERTMGQQMLAQAHAIVLAIDSGPDQPADPATVRDVLGLTLGEARIAALIGSGLSPRDAANRLGLTEESTRTSLKRVFTKVGVSRQSELTALLSRLVIRQIDRPSP